MKIPTKQMLQAEFFIQSLLYVPMLLLYFGAIFISKEPVILGLLLQFFLGIFQVSTAIIRSIRHQSQIRKKYFFAAFAYVASLMTAMFIFDDFSMDKVPKLWIVFGIVVPVSMASFYWFLTLMQVNGKYTEIDTPTSEIDLLKVENSDIVVNKIMERHKRRINK